MYIAGSSTVISYRKELQTLTLFFLIEEFSRKLGVGAVGWGRGAFAFTRNVVIKAQHSLKTQGSSNGPVILNVKCTYTL